MDQQEAQEVLAQALSIVRRRTYADVLHRAPRLKKRTRLLGITVGETFEPLEDSYSRETYTAPSGRHYNVTTEVFWSDYATRVVGVMVCVDYGGPSARHPLCQSIEYDPPAE